VRLAREPQYPPGTEQAFIELARQCERYGNLPAAATMFQCAAERAADEGRSSPHAAVGTHQVAAKLYPASDPDEHWRQAEALDIVGSLTDGVESVSDRWAAARVLPCAAGEESAGGTVTGSRGDLARRARAATFELDVEEVGHTHVAGEYGRLCVMDCLDAGICYDASLYFLEFSRKDNHYRLLKHLSRALSLAHAAPLILDLGTHAGGSSAALASSDSKVISYDIEDRLKNQAATCGEDPAAFRLALPNVEYRIGDIMQLSPALLLEADMIVLDTAHEGEWEEQVYEYLCAHKFRGLLFLDDIHANMAMELFWSGIAHRKYDLTAVGHAISGSGLVDFGGQLRVKGL